MEYLINLARLLMLFAIVGFFYWFGKKMNEGFKADPLGESIAILIIAVVVAAAQTFI